MIKMKGLEALAPFIERFFAIGFHTGTSALVGYGLAKGKGMAILPDPLGSSYAFELQHYFCPGEDIQINRS